MHLISSYFPGQLATILLETKNSDGYSVDSSTLPYISNVYGITSTSGFTTYDGYLRTDGYNQPLTKIATGLYYGQVTLPKLAASIGSYFVNVVFTNPTNGFPDTQRYQLIVTAPFGNFGVTTG
jgi:hypothetical protein